MHDLKELRADADRCERAMDTTRDNSLRRRFAARGREFAALVAVLQQGREKGKQRKALSHRSCLSKAERAVHVRSD
jgi:hypothetical protein